MPTPLVPLAKPPAVLPATIQQQREAERRTARQLAGATIERGRQLRGLLWLAAVVLVLSVARAGAGFVFPGGWWRLW